MYSCPLKYQNTMKWFPFHRETRSLNCHTTAQYGGTGGSNFQDACHSAIKKIDIWSAVDGLSTLGEVIRGIQITYTDILYREHIGTRHAGTWEITTLFTLLWGNA